MICRIVAVFIFVAYCFELSFLPHTAHASDAPGILIEFNSLERIDDSCKFSFVVLNSKDLNLEEMALEVVLFDVEDRIQQMTVMNFQSAPAMKTRVRQFLIPDLKCSEVGKFLINRVSVCRSSVDELSECDQWLKLANRTKIEFLN